ncbi:MAG: glycosyltransferase family 61 protein [Vitreoscilla sp.]|nr:glycosyltransferase family 61 protein [Vitreoscilla sp.]
MPPPSIKPLQTLPGVRVVANLSAAERYVRPRPTRLHVGDASAEPFLVQFDKVQGQLPAQNLYALPGALVMDKGTMLVGGSVVKDNTEGAPMARVLAALEANVPAPVRHIDFPLLYTSRYGVKNYGHCLTDIVPRIAQSLALEPGLKVGLHPEFVPTARDALRDLGVDSDRIVELDEQPTLLTQARFASPCNAHPITHSPRSLALLRARLPVLCEDAPPSPPRLFVTRSDASTRHLNNHDEVAAELQRLGFTEVATGAMPHARQAALFAQAEEIVGLAGASMTNLIYCRPGTRVTVLSPATMSALYFWDLAAQLGLDFRIGYFPATQTQRGIHSNFSANWAEVKALCSSVS